MDMQESQERIDRWNNRRCVYCQRLFTMFVTDDDMPDEVCISCWSLINYLGKRPALARQRKPWLVSQSQESMGD